MHHLHAGLDRLVGAGGWIVAGDERLVRVGTGNDGRQRGPAKRRRVAVGEADSLVGEAVDGGSLSGLIDRGDRIVRGRHVDGGLFDRRPIHEAVVIPCLVVAEDEDHVRAGGKRPEVPGGDIASRNASEGQVAEILHRASGHLHRVVAIRGERRCGIDGQNLARDRNLHGVGHGDRPGGGVVEQVLDDDVAATGEDVLVEGCHQVGPRIHARGSVRSERSDRRRRRHAVVVFRAQILDLVDLLRVQHVIENGHIVDQATEPTRVDCGAVRTGADGKIAESGRGMGGPERIGSHHASIEVEGCAIGFMNGIGDMLPGVDRDRVVRRIGSRLGDGGGSVWQQVQEQLSVRGARACPPAHGEDFALGTAVLPPCDVAALSVAVLPFDPGTQGVVGGRHDSGRCPDRIIHTIEADRFAEFATTRRGEHGTAFHSAIRGTRRVGGIAIEGPMMDELGRGVAPLQCQHLACVALAQCHLPQMIEMNPVTLDAVTIRDDDAHGGVSRGDRLLGLPNLVGAGADSGDVVVLTVGEAADDEGEGHATIQIGAHPCDQAGEVGLVVVGF